MKVDKYLLKAIKQLIKNPKYQVDNGVLIWLDERQIPNLDKIKNIAKDIELNYLQTAKTQTIKSDLQNYLLSYTLASGTVIKNSLQDQANNLKNIALSQQAMQAGKWVASTDYALNSVANISGTICLCTTAGKTGTTAPTPPTKFGVTVTDNTAEWKLLGFLVNTSKGRVYFTPQSILEMSQEIELLLNSALTKYDDLKNQISNATTQADLDKIKW